MKTAAQIMKSKRFIKARMDAGMAKAESDALWEKAERGLGEIMAQYAGGDPVCACWIVGDKVKEPGDARNEYNQVTIQDSKSQMLRIRDCGRPEALRALSAPEKSFESVR